MLFAITGKWPICPDADVLLKKIADIGPSGQESEHFFDGGFPEHTLRGEYRNFTVAELKPEDFAKDRLGADAGTIEARRTEEHTSELQSLMRSSYAVF